MGKPPYQLGIEGDGTRKCTRVADLAFSDGESLGHNRVILGVRRLRHAHERGAPHGAWRLSNSRCLSRLKPAAGVQVTELEYRSNY